MRGFYKTSYRWKAGIPDVLYLQERTLFCAELKVGNNNGYENTALRS
jgi:hypothetical protein